MRTFHYLWLLPMALLALSGCSQVTGTSSSAAEPAPNGSGMLRAINVAMGPKSVSVSLNNQAIAHDVTLGAASNLQSVPAGTSSLTAAGPDGKPVSVAVQTALKDGDRLTAVVTGGSDKLEVVPFIDAKPSASAGSARVTLLQASKDILTATPRIDAKSNPISLKFGEASTPIELAPGKHLVQVDFTRNMAAVAAPTPKPVAGAAAPKPSDPSKPAPTPIMIVPVQSGRLSVSADFQAGKEYSLVVSVVGAVPHLWLVEDKGVEAAPSAASPSSKEIPVSKPAPTAKKS